MTRGLFLRGCLEGEGGVVGDVRDGDSLWVGEWTSWIRILPSLRSEIKEAIHSFDLQAAVLCQSC